MSIPLIIFGSQLLMGIMERYPIIITAGAALLGYVAGEMLVTDKGLEGVFAGLPGWVALVIKLGAAVAVVLVGQAMARRQSQKASEAA